MKEKPSIQKLQMNLVYQNTVSKVINNKPVPENTKDQLYKKLSS